MAELVDAADSKSAIRKDVKVRFLSWAHFFLPVLQMKTGFFMSVSRLGPTAFNASFMNCSFVVNFVFPVRIRIAHTNEVLFNIRLSFYAIVPIIRPIL